MSEHWIFCMRKYFNAYTNFTQTRREGISRTYTESAIQLKQIKCLRYVDEREKTHNYFRVRVVHKRSQWILKQHSLRALCGVYAKCKWQYIISFMYISFCSSFGNLSLPTFFQLAINLALRKERAGKYIHAENWDDGSCAVGSDSGINNECEIPITSQLLHKDWFCTQFTWNEVSNMNAWRTFNWWLAFVGVFSFAAQQQCSAVGRVFICLDFWPLLKWTTKVHYRNAPCYAMRCNNVQCGCLCKQQWYFCGFEAHKTLLGFDTQRLPLLPKLVTH